MDHRGLQWVLIQDLVLLEGEIRGCLHKGNTKADSFALLQTHRQFANKQQKSEMRKAPSYFLKRIWTCWQLHDGGRVCRTLGEYNSVV